MVFSSIPFLFFFLPLCLILYYLVPYKHKNTVLLIFSLIFYAWGEPVYILLLLFATMVDYCSGRLMTRFGTTAGRRRIFLIISVGINLSVLAFFKYADFLIGTVNGIFNTSVKPLGLGLPVGISFFTFQTMSYTIDLYKGEVPVEKSYKDYLTYVSMFPQLVAGPIVRYATVQKELRGRRIDKTEVYEGFLRFLRGLFKKVLLANNVGALWEEIRLLGVEGTSAASGVQALAHMSAATAWLGAAAFTLQLYFDFSAYSDMAIGMGRMLGFHFPENFIYPLSSVSITDFWRRWHISLGTWFRDYVYIPLGGNRKGTARHLRNMFVVWFLTGLWHGAAWNFVLWGLYHGVLLALEKYVWGKWLKKLPKFFQHLYSIIIVVVGFVIFVCEDMGEIKLFISSMLLLAGNPLWGSECLWYLGNYGTVLLVAAVLAFPVYPWIKERLERIEASAGEQSLKMRAVYIVSAVGYVSLFFVSVAFLVSDTYNPFLYFRF